MSKWNINWTRSCSDVVAFACVILSLLLEATATPRGGRTGGWTGREGGGQSGQVGGQGGQGGGQGTEVNNGVDGVPDFSTITAQQLQNLLPTILAQVGSQGSRSGEWDNQKVKYTAGSFVGNDLTWWNSQIHTRGRESVVGMPWESFNTLTREEFCSSNEIQKLETELLKSGLLSGLARLAKDRNRREDNKRTRARNAFETTTNPVRRENTSVVPKCTTCNFHHPPETPFRTCFNCNHPGNFAKDCRVVPKNVESGSEARGNHQNQVVAVNGGQGHGNNDNQARGGAFMLGAREARRTEHHEGDENEIEGHLFDINLIPFGSGSFDMIIGMDWLSNHKAEIICHEKVVRIPQPDGKVLRVIGERPEEKMRHLRSAKTKEQKQEEIVVIRDYPEVFLGDLSRLPPIWEIEFRIESLEQYRSRNLPIYWHLLKWRICRVNSKNSKTQVPCLSRRLPLWHENKVFLITATSYNCMSSFLHQL
ncbi:putative reverse transcriptase domain-containing protein [Tanacetum coccineum]